MATATSEQSPHGLKIMRQFTKEGGDPLNSVGWLRTNAIIRSADGKEQFRQDDVSVPDWWDPVTIGIVAEKYFRVIKDPASKPVKENSARHMFQRVGDWIYQQGLQQHVFATDEDAQAFRDELLFMLVQGWFAFNSPVWFNVGVKDVPQCSACFIQSAGDTMKDIMALQYSQVMLFKGGSGTGSNYSTLRSSYETLSTGGHASGPVSFMKGFDAYGGITKSGGSTRRAASMARLDVDHPDILEQRDGSDGFIPCKAFVEILARDLAESGHVTSEWNKAKNAYDFLPFQNANHSVGAPDEFMRAVTEDADWQTKKVKTGEVVHTYKAKKLFGAIVEAAHRSGDPGMQFDTTINAWHTCPEGGRIRASNPCSEFLFIDDSACNLASLNLMRFADGPQFAVEHFIHATQIGITAMEILIDASSYPTEKITANARKYRPLGIGYTNLGALLTYWGLPYDSNKGRGVAAALTALMTGAAYLQSARLAEVRGSFTAYEDNRGYMNAVLRKHFDAVKRLPSIMNEARRGLTDRAFDVWREACAEGEIHGYRHAQVSVLAPTGTISFLLGADTTSLEPLLAIVTKKKLVGQGETILPNRVLEPALRNLGYTEEVIDKIVAYIKEKEDIHGAPGFDERQHGAIFAEALGRHAIAPEAHIDMMAAVQPFLSGAISKTVNMPSDATIEQVGEIYLRAWRAGLKSIAIFRDGCKLTQPINSGAGAKTRKARLTERRKLPDDRVAKNEKFSIQGHEGYITLGFYNYEEGEPYVVIEQGGQTMKVGPLGEIFIRMAKEGSSLAGWVDSVAQAISFGLQHGVPVELYCEKFIGTRFDPAGFTESPIKELRSATSVLDYTFKLVRSKYLARTDAGTKELLEVSFDGPPCDHCGTFTQRAGTCYLCPNCGTTTGCG